MTFITPAAVKKAMAPRPKDSHKGHNGHVLVIAGSRGMMGAPQLCALGALRVGSGLVTLAVPESERSIASAQLPEAMTLGLSETPDGTISEGAIESLLAYTRTHNVNTLAVGPGLGVNGQVASAVNDILDEFDLPLVLDADGLNNVSPEDLRGYAELVITPHPAELSRLLGIDRVQVKKDRQAFAQNTARDLELVCVLKGFQTVISDGKTTRVNKTGNPAMAAGGMGDVLTGIIAGLLAQGLDRLEAASAGVYLHGLAGDLARVSDRGLLAREVADAIPQALRKTGVR